MTVEIDHPFRLSAVWREARRANGNYPHSDWEKNLDIVLVY
jgi:hypothetical protein